MENDITRKIDTLVEMTESTLNLSTAKLELQEIDNQIIFLKTELDMIDDGKKEKYFKASEKQVDENIKISLEAKIKKQERSIQELQKDIDEVVEEETVLHDILTKLQSNINSSKEYIAILNDRFSTISDSSNKSYYQKLLHDENQKLSDLISSLIIKEEEHNKVLEKLNGLNANMSDMRATLENEKDRLTETKESLLNPLSYINNEMKSIDENRKLEIKKELKELENRRIEILNDPVIIAGEAQDYIIKDDREKALSKIRELVSIAKTKPFMDILSGSELTAMLKEEEENATLARDEFAQFIDSKNYMDHDNKVIEERINYLELEIKSLEEKIRIAKEEIKRIDTVEIQELNNRLACVMEVEAELGKDLNNYQIIMESEQEDKTPKRRAILSAAFNTKQVELSNVLNLINHYRNDQKKLIAKAYELEANEIKKYESEILTRQEEILEMTSLLKNTNKVKDVLAIENDKKKLKELDDVVKDIKNREKYNQTPTEIYDEIEIYIGSMGLDLSFGSEQKDDSYDVDYSNYEDNIDDDFIKTDNSAKEFVVDDSISREEDLLDDSYKDLEKSNIDMNIITELPVEEEKLSEKLKVVNVEYDNEVDNSYLIGSYDEVI